MPLLLETQLSEYPNPKGMNLDLLELVLRRQLPARGQKHLRNWTEYPEFDGGVRSCKSFGDSRLLKISKPPPDTSWGYF